MLEKRFYTVFALLLTLLASIGRAGAVPGDATPLGDDAPVCAGAVEPAENTPCSHVINYEMVPASPVELRAAGTYPADPSAALPIRPIDHTTAEAAVYSYAKVVSGDTPIYDAPAGNVVGSTGEGFIFYTTAGSQEVNGVWWTQISRSQWIRQDALLWREPTEFKGVYLEDWPAHEFAWMLDPHQPLLTPNGLPNKDAPFLERYAMVVIYATVWVGEWRYYMIAPEQWVRETWLGKVRTYPVPEGVSGKWFDIDLYEQTMVAYEDERPVFATLIASGLQQWSTTEGLFKVYYKVANAPMSGAHGEPDYYYLENVPYSLYFNEGAAVHGAYWHDGFGYRRSHGCVNIAPADAMMLFEWADEGTWVHVHSSSEYR